MYQLRCDFVHRGETEGIKPEHLEFADRWLANVVRNIVRYPSRFSSKEDVRDFAAAVQAKEVLKRYKPRHHGFMFVESRWDLEPSYARRNEWRW